MNGWLGGMKYLIIGIAFSIMSAFVGCLLPFVSFGSNAKAPVNILWGFIYGLGWYAAGLLSDPRNPGAAPSTGSSGSDETENGSLNHRPRRLHKNRTRYSPGITTSSHGKMYATAVIA